MATNTEQISGRESPSKLWFALVGSAFLAVSLFLSWERLGGVAEHILAGLAGLVVGVPTAYDGIRELRRNPFGSDVLMIVAATGAAAIGAYEEAAAVLILYNFAEATEYYTVEKVRGIAGRMATLLPKRALVKKNGDYVEVPVEELKVGDVISVKPGWRVPVDGKIVIGNTNVDQSTITGEAMPVSKSVGDSLLSGSLNIDGSIELEVGKPFSDSMVSKIVHLVVESREKKASVERFIDRFSRFYTPSMILLAIGIALVPTTLLGQPFGVWVYRAMIALVVACPSALVIATPITMLIGLTRAMWSSVLIKGGKYLEELSKIRVVAFDKTGTLTKGNLSVESVQAASGFSEGEVLRYAAIAESRSSHPIATAIAREARGGLADVYCEVTEVAGKGLIATLADGRSILVGRHSFVGEQQSGRDGEHSHSEEGSAVDVVVDGQFAGTISLADEIREDAKSAIAALKSEGLEVVMLTGDNARTAKEISDRLGIEEFHPALLPQDKVRIVGELKQERGKVLMVGDGVNDAPVLAASDVGVAVGTAGSDIAIQAADVALLGSDLGKVPYLLRLGRKATSRAKLNIGIALALKLTIISAGVLGLVPLWVGVIGDDGVTLIIIGLALPILGMKD